MPICKSCLKGFDSDHNICPYCEHDQNKRSYRALFSVVFLFTFLYLAYQFSFQTISVTVDGIPSKDFAVYQQVKRFHRANEKGKVTFFHLFGDKDVAISLRIVDQSIIIPKGNDTKINIETKTNEIIIETGNFFTYYKTKVPYKPRVKKK